MKIEESFLVEAPQQEVWSVIRDAATIAPCVPGCRQVEPLDEHRYRARIQVALGPIKTEFQMVIEITDEVAPHSLTTVSRGEEGGRASSLSATSRLRLAATDARSTRIDYESDVTLTGRLGNYGLGLMKKRAQALGKEFAMNLQQLLAQRASTQG